MKKICGYKLPFNGMHCGPSHITLGLNSKDSQVKASLGHGMNARLCFEALSQSKKISE